ncbi:coiled-coil domain-containing protein 160 [Suncus etruscus]|uniref:coiled-coil domain-containing protein 160 n=1 Tax=Suncus etruscus TaxID=109475 RepID=UPI002110D66B|nr:coiled-coil domain-containing protein 160 [Suncus etruscus]
MDASDRKKQWKESSTPSHCMSTDLEGLPFPVAEKKSVEPKKKTVLFAPSTKKCQEDIYPKTQDNSYQKVKQPNVRNDKMNILNNAASPRGVRFGSSESHQANAPLSRINRVRPQIGNKIEGISSLRRFKTTKKTTEVDKSFAVPKSHLNILDEKLQELNLKCQKTEADLQSAEQVLAASRHSSSEEVDDYGMLTAPNAQSPKDLKIAILRDELLEKTLTIKNLTKDLEYAEQVIQQQNMANRKLKASIIKLKSQNYISNTLLKEELHLQYKLELQKVRDELEALKTELRAEKANQARNNKSLEVLRKYFTDGTSFAHSDNQAEEDSI